MKNVGFIGWRGMVGSVLMQRMVEERDFDAIRPVFFSTSQLGQAAPTFGGSTGGTLQDAFDLEALKALDIIVTCQGGDYTNEIYPKLRESGWQGYWIDAASSLRMKDDAIIILAPSRVTGTSSWPSVDHLVSRLPPLTVRPLQARFHCGYVSRDTQPIRAYVY